MSGIIKDIDKGKGEIIRVEISEFKGKKLLNLRVWYTDANNEYKQRKKESQSHRSFMTKSKKQSTPPVQCSSKISPWGCIKRFFYHEEHEGREEKNDRK